MCIREDKPCPLNQLVTKVPILKEVNFGKVKLWDVEHFWTLFVFTFGCDCYCIQQSRPKMKTKSIQKCSTSQSFTLPKWHSFKIGTLVEIFGNLESIIGSCEQGVVGNKYLINMQVHKGKNSPTESISTHVLGRAVAWSKGGDGGVL